jgi:UvrD-like helicase C-terminal domain/AAA domain
MVLILESIRNRVNYKLKENDIYIGGNYKKGNLSASLLKLPYDCDIDFYKSYLKGRLLNPSCDREFLQEFNNLVEKHTSSNDFNLLTWVENEGRIILEVVNEWLAGQSERGKSGLELLKRSDSDLEEKFTVGLTACQKNALEIYSDFLASNKNSLLVTGGGGVGKSFLVERMITLSGRENCIILSPKHKIKKLHEGKNVLLNETYQSFFGIQPNYKKVCQRTGKIPYEIKNTWKTRQKIDNLVDENTIIFFDECSMIPEDVFNAINNFLAGSKRVYIGDESQIEPIGETTSKTITDCDIRVELNEVVRYSGELLAYCTTIRNEILSGNDSFSFHGKKNDSTMIESLTSDTTSIMLFLKNYQNGIDTRILTFTNERMESYNQQLNRLLFSDEFEEGYHYFTGQKLISNGKSNDYRPCGRLSLLVVKDKNYLSNRNILNKFDEIVIQSIDICSDSILSSLNMNKEINNYLLDELIDTFGLYKDVESFGRESFIKLINQKFNWYFLTVVDENNIELTLRTIDKEDEEDYIKLVESFKRDRYWLIANFLLSMNDWLQPSLSLTIDQSQGSTYQQVILDCNGIKNKENIRRYYVGISRAKEKLFLVN